MLGCTNWPECVAAGHIDEYATFCHTDEVINATAPATIIIIL
jgi:hypothetical protein